MTEHLLGSDEGLVRAAQLYYEEGLNQRDVAIRLDVSRTTVSRLLKEARARGIVRISIHRPIEVREELSNQLAVAFGLERAVVVAGDTEYEVALENVGHAAAEMLLELVEPRDVVGVSWGHTMFHMVQALPDCKVEGVTVVQMCGCVGESNPELDGPDLVRRMARKLGGTYRYVHAPTVVESGELRDQLIEQPLIKEALSSLAHADVCVFSVGTLEGGTSSLARSGYLSTEERETLVEDGAVGHMVARMIDAHGDELEQYNRRVIAIPLSYLRRARWSVCVAASIQKAAGTLAALRGGYVNTLVVDHLAAQEILHLDKADIG